MSTPTTDAPKFVETPGWWCPWMIEHKRLYDIDNQLRDEMALLPRTDELMKHYEKIYTESDDNIRRHHYPSQIEALIAQRELIDNTNGSRDYEINRCDESIASLRQQQRAISAGRKDSDWDIYFSIRKPEEYFVNVYFPRPADPPFYTKS